MFDWSSGSILTTFSENATVSVFPPLGGGTSDPDVAVSAVASVFSTDVAADVLAASPDVVVDSLFEQDTKREQTSIMTRKTTKMLFLLFIFPPFCKCPALLFDRVHLHHSPKKQESPFMNSGSNSFGSSFLISFSSIALRSIFAPVVPSSSIGHTMRAYFRSDPKSGK